MNSDENKIKQASVNSDTQLANAPDPIELKLSEDAGENVRLVASPADKSDSDSQQAPVKSSPVASKTAGQKPQLERETESELRLKNMVEKNLALSSSPDSDHFKTYLAPVAKNGSKSGARSSSSELGEQLLVYRPFAGTEQWLEYRFSAWNSLKAWFAMLLVVAFLLGGGPGKIIHALTTALVMGFVPREVGGVQQDWTGSALVLQFFFGLIALLVAFVCALYLSTPTNVVLTDNYIGLDWRKERRRKRKKLAWRDITRIDMVWPAGRTSPQDCQIKFKSRKDKEGQYSLSLKLGAIIKEADRGKLLNAIEKFAPDAQKDVKLLEVLTPAQDHSYTELWLQALSAPPKRERLTPLSEDSELLDGRYKVIRQLGVGGQGTAYLTLDKDEMHEVVLKEFILPVYVDTNVLRQALERMQNEAAILRKLDNDRIVRLSNFFVEDHRGYLVLEKIDGDSLEQIVVREGRMDEARVASLAQQMCLILGYLHALEPAVIHRDFTPDNLILGKDGTLKLVDFNVAQQTESTATGTVVGKHSYISPEQFRGRPTPQSDIYAMGATMFYLLTGEAPEPIKVSHPKKKRTDVSDALDTIVARATAFDTAKRYARIEELEADLAALQQEPANNQS